MTPLKLTDESLNTLLCEVEAVLNHRPLTEISSDPDDAEPLTPNHIYSLTLKFQFNFKKGSSKKFP